MDSAQKIYIVGAGAIGKALAVNLMLDNKDVLLVRANVDNLPPQKEKIQLLQKNGEIQKAEVHVTTFNNIRQINGIIIITAKSYSNTIIAKRLNAYVEQFPIIIMQNGLGIEKPFTSLHYKNIYRCVLFATSQISDRGIISFKPVTCSPIGVVRETYSKLENIVSQINTKGFQFCVCKDIQKIIWEKAIINSVYNSICPLVETDNGIFFRNDSALSLANEIIKECVALGKTYKIELDEKVITDKLLTISKNTEHQLISTFQDIKNGRKTEIESLNLEMSRMAKMANKPDLVKLTKFLGEMIALKSGLNQNDKRQ